MKKTIKLLIIALAITNIKLYAQEIVIDKFAEQKKEEKHESLKIGARIQTRLMMGEKDSDFATNEDYNAVDFNFRRLRLSLVFQGAKWYGGYLELKGESMLQKSKSVIQEANLWVKLPFLSGKITMGQFKIPFIRESVQSSSRLMFNEAAFSASTTQEQDIGIKLSLKPLLLMGSSYEHFLDFDASVTNGEGSGQNGVGYKSVEAVNSNVNPLFNWRVQVNPFGGLIKNGKDKGWVEGEEYFSKDMKLSIGYGGLYTKDSDYAAKMGIQDNGENLNGHTFDATFAMAGVYANAEFTTFMSSAAYKNTYTYQGTLGYNIPVSDIYVMPALRYNYFQSDTAADGITDEDKFADIWAGINIYGNKHNFKAQVFYQIKRDKAGTDADLNPVDKKDNVFYFQVQTNFGKKV
ncbi:MAG: hypothetical protein OEZ13_05485 [Spirochaetia bacterium]|nr:hypothetical protein [Spirochaetia bacterium]